MIAVKKYYKVVIEVDLRVLVGEIVSLEKDFHKMSLSQLLEVWGPEIERYRVLLSVKDTENEKPKRGRRKKGRSQRVNGSIE